MSKQFISRKHLHVTEQIYGIVGLWSLCVFEEPDSLLNNQMRFAFPFTFADRYKIGAVTPY